MRKRTIFLSLAAVLVAVGIATPFVLAPGQPTQDNRPPEAVAAAEHAATVEALRPPKRERPVIAVATFNKATEITDFLVSYGVLKRADVADITVVAERDERVQLYPTRLAVDADESFAAFDQRVPEGADYVVVPAMDPGTDPALIAWILAQRDKGAKIVSICNGSRVLANAGLLDGRRATGHWSVIADLRKAQPEMTYVADRRYVADNGVSTSTGITASVPTMLTLIEAIAGTDKAAAVAAELGVESWDARHRSATFELTLEHKKTFIRNALSFGRKETVGLPLEEGADEVALSLTADAWSRSSLATVVLLGEPVTSRNGLTLYPDRPAGTEVDHLLPAPSGDKPALSIEQQLPLIAARYDAPSAGIAALQMEYAWTPTADQLASR
ncbi:MAG TPA: DJ-1/PfpI family protein [Devosia sp.]